MKYVLVAMLLALEPATVLAAAEPPELVLVSSKDSVIGTLSINDIRRLYLGAPVVAQGQRIVPFRNASDSLMVEVFLQNVVFMSGPAYERQLLSRVYRLGGQQPAVYEQRTELLTALGTDPAAVTFMWRDAARQNPELRIIATLWSGSRN